MPCIYGGGQVQNITFVVQGVPSPRGKVEKDKQKKPRTLFSKSPTVQTTVFFAKNLSD